MSEERLKLAFGFVVVSFILILGVIIIFAKVQQETAHGLQDVIDILGPVLGMWAQWAFSARREEPKV